MHAELTLGLGIAVSHDAVDEHDSRIVGPSLEADEARAFLGDGTGQAALGPINHVALNVTDLRRSEPWYAHAFGLVRLDGEVAEDGSGHVVLLSPTGGWMLSLTGVSPPGQSKIRRPSGPGATSSGR